MDATRALWNHVARRREARARLALVRQAIVIVIAATAAYFTVTLNASASPMFEVFGRLAAGVMVYAGIVLGIKHGAPRLWHAERERPQ